MAGAFDSYIDVVEAAVNPLDPVFGGVAGAWLDVGVVFTGLTYDDVGGVAYLLGTNNVVRETLLPDVSAADPAQEPVDSALRPGVEKTTFVPHPLDVATGGFSTFTNEFTDTYYSNGVAFRQQLRRIVTQPDFLFSATDTSDENSWPIWVERTAPTKWINNSWLNGDRSRPGPGVIAPPIDIAFHKLGTFVSSDDLTHDCTSIPFRWGSFDVSTNAPIAFPTIRSGREQSLRIHFVLMAGNGPALPIARYAWEIPVALQKEVLLQTSTNLVDWATLDTVVNDASVLFWEHRGSMQSRRFFRAIPRY